MTKWRKPATKLKAHEIITWRELNERLRQVESEKEAENIYKGLLLSKRASKRMLTRAYSRYSRLRRRREHQEMKRKAEVK